MLVRHLPWAAVTMVFLSVGTTIAGPNAGGTLIVHDASVAWSTDQPSVITPAPATCASVDNNVPAVVPANQTGWLWKVYAAFPAGSSPRLKALAFGERLSAGCRVIAAGVADPDAAFEITQNGWPNTDGGGVGISWTWPRTDRIAELYWFAGYSEYEDGSDYFGTMPHTTQNSIFVDDAIPPHEDAIAAFSTLGFGTPSVTQCPPVTGSTGACCFVNATCHILTQANCQLIGGDFQGVGVSCTPTRCDFRLLGGNVYPVNGISAAPDSFATILEAIQYMQTFGVGGTGQVILELSPGYLGEAGPLTVPLLTGVSSSLGLTIRPALGHSVFSTTTGTAAEPYAIKITGRWITLDGRAGGDGSDPAWHIRCVGGGSTGYGQSALRVDNTTNTVTGVTIRNCVLEADAPGLTSGIVGIAGGTTNQMSDVVLQDNLVRSLGTSANSCRGYGIVVGGASNAANTGLLIKGNRIDKVAHGGIRFGDASFGGLVISGNEIWHSSPVTQATTGSFAGLGLSGSGMTGARIEGNFVHDIQVTNPSESLTGILQTAGATGVKIANNVIEVGSGVSSGSVTVRGICLSSGTGSYSIDNNTVLIQGSISTGSAGSAALWKLANPTVELRNNILANTRRNTGVASATHWVIALNNTTGVTAIGANDYWSAGAGGVLGTTNGQTTGNQYNLDEWTVAVPGDMESVVQDPHFVDSQSAPPNLRIDADIPTLLESGGLVLADVGTDFEGEIRHGFPGYVGNGTAPDIGADEFEGTIAPPASLVPGIYPVNGIDNAPQSFADISSAVRYLVQYGASGSGEIVLELSPGYVGEPGPVWMPRIAGLSATLGLVVRPAADLFPVTAVAGTATERYAIRITGSHITLSGEHDGAGSEPAWTIRCTGSGASGYGESAVRIETRQMPLAAVSVRNCILEAEAANSTSGVLALTGGVNAAMSAVTLEHNTIRSSGAAYRGVGVFISGATNAANTGLAIRQNTINQIANGGIYLSGTFANVIVEGNDIFHTTTVPPNAATTFYGIDFEATGMPGAVVRDNFVHDIDLATTGSWIAGIYLGAGNSTGARVKIYNNRIALRPLVTSASTVLAGIYAYTATSAGQFDIENNSVYIGGVSTVSTASSAAFRKNATATASYVVRNNVFCNGRSNGSGATGTHWGIAINSTACLTTLNNNDYFADGNGGVLGTTNGSTSGNIHTMSAWRTAVALDTQSISAHPHYVAPAATPPDLKVDVALPSHLESRAVAVAGIANDFEGEPRQGTPGYGGTGVAPDLGADEFESPVPGPLAAGVYPVNGVDAGEPALSFATLSSALSYLGIEGASGTGSVVLELSPGYVGEPGPLTIGAIAGLGPDLELRIRPAAGFAALTAVPGSSSTRSAIRILGSYVALDGRGGGNGVDQDWTIRCNGSGAGGYGESAVRVDNSGAAVTNVSIRNCILEAEAANGTSAILAITGTSNIMAAITVEDNTIRSTGNTATTCRGYAVDVSGLTNSGNSGLVIRNNRISQFAYGGINLAGAFPGATVEGNEIYHSVQVAQPAASRVWGLKFGSDKLGGTIIAGNFIHDLQLAGFSNWMAGIYFETGNTTGQRVRVHSNRIAIGPGLAGTLPIYGVWINNTGLYDIDYNSVFVGGSPSGSGGSVAFYRSWTCSLNLRNNIFHNGRSSAGSNYAINLNDASGIAEIGHNDYYASGTNGCLGYFSGARCGLAEWQNSVPADAGSVSHDPHFISPTGAPPDLRINVGIPSALESRGIAVAGIEADFEGDARQGSPGYEGTGEAPDIGADEFESPIMGPLTAGTYPINGADFGNPPVSFASLSSGLAYLGTVGATGAGEILFELSPGYVAEPGPVTIGSIAGLGPDLHLIIRPAAGFTALTLIPGSTTVRSAIRVLGSHVTLDGRAGGSGTSRDWTIRCTGAGAAGNGESAVRLDASQFAMSDVTVRNCVLEAEAANASSAILAITGNASLALTDIRLLSNLVRSTGSGATNCRGIGIDFSGANHPANSGLAIEGNTVNQVSLGGITLAGSCPGATISRNEIFHTSPVTQPTASTFWGIKLASDKMAGARIEANFVHDLKLTNGSNWASGISLWGSNVTGTPVRVCNNRVAVGSGIAVANLQVFGIQCSGGGLIDVDDNSVYLSGTTPSTGIISAALTKYTDTATIRIRGNILHNARSCSGASKNYAIYLDTATGVSEIDYNDYYWSGTNGCLGYLAGNRCSLQEWRTASPGDVHSIDQDPHFIAPQSSPPDLKVDPVLAGLVESGGVTIPGVDEDFEGEPRQGSPGYEGTGTSPDIGADEFEAATLPPNTLITEGPAESSWNDVTNVLMAWTGEDDDTPVSELLYHYRMDASGWSAFGPETSHEFSPVAEGWHTFEVAARDEADLEDPTPATRIFAVDRTPPETQITSGPPAGGWLADTTAVFVWTATDLAPAESLRFSFVLDGGVWEPFSHGTTRTFTHLASGLHEFQVKALDLALHEDPTPATRTFRVDVTAPETAASGVAPGDTLVSSTLTVTWSGTDDQTPPSQLQYSYRLDGGNWSSFGSAGAVNLTSLSDGHHVVLVKSKDLAGNQDQSPAVLDFYVDALSPVVTVTSGPAQGQHVSSNAVAFTWTAVDAMTPRADLEFSHVFDGASSDWSADTVYAATDLGEGTHTFQAKARDMQQHVGSATRQFVVDFTPPTTTLTAGPSEGGWVTLTTVQFCWQGADNLSLPNQLQFCYRLDHGNWSTWSTSTCVTLSSLGEGEHHFEVKARDKAGNEDLSPAERNFAVGYIDLVVAALQTPTTGFFDRPVQITWRVKNEGEGPATGSWYDRVWLSTDNAPGSDTQLAEFQRPTSLAAGESYEVEREVVIPARAEGSYWLIVTADGRNNVTEVNAEGNNNRVSADPLFLTLPPYPDLRVAELNHPAEGWSGQAIEISWRVTNAGAGNALAPWKDRVYVSPDTLVNGNDVLVGTFEQTGNLPAGGDYLAIHPVTLPPDISGEYYLFVKTDALDAIEEYDREDNNLLKSTPIVVALSPHPDLTVETVAGPFEADAGDHIEVHWVVRNVGGAATDAPAWSDRVYLSPQSVIVPGQTYTLGTFGNPAYLPAGEAYQNTKDVVVPSGIAGSYYVIVKTDINNQVNEHAAEGNNLRAVDEPMVVRYLTPFLRVTSVQIPTSGWSGELISVRWIVENVGEATFTSNHWDDGMALSNDDTYSTNDTNLGSGFWHNTPLAPGERDTLASSVRLPNGISGLYHLFVLPNVHQVQGVQGLPGSDSISVTLSPPPDLEVTAFTAAADSVRTGSPLGVQWTVTNEGAGVTNVPQWQDAIYISADTELNTSADSRLALVAATEYLNPGEYYTKSQNIVVPSSMYGTYYLFALTDAQGQLYEGPYEGNNSRILGPITVYLTPPDLQVTSVAPLGTCWSGTEVPVRWVVQNLGTGTTSPGVWKDRVYVSSDEVLSPSTDTVLATVQHSGALAPLQSYSDTVMVPLPDGFQGALYVFVTTDVLNAVAEYNAEGNNSGYTGLSVELTPPPDLAVVGGAALGEAWSGEPVQLQWTVRNIGSGGTPTSAWTDVLFFSADSVFQAGSDLLLATVPHNGALLVDSVYTALGSGVIPNGASGRQYVFVWADRAGAVYEHGQEENNLYRISLDVVLTPPPDLFVSQVVTDAEAWSGQPWPVTWEIANIGPGPTAGDTWTDAVFLSADSALSADDLVLARREHTGTLNPGEAYGDSGSFVLPNGLQGGRFLLIVADSTNAVFEHTAEENNIRSHEVTVQLTPPPDLRVLTLQGPPYAVAGQTSTVQYSVSNAGTGGTVSTAWVDRIYLSADMTISPQTDVLLTTVNHQGVLGPAEGYLESRAVVFPPNLTGTYYLLCATDETGLVYEHGAEGNNVRGVGVEISAPSPTYPDLTVSQLSILGKSLQDKALTVTVEWRVENLTAYACPPTQSYWNDAIYLSSDAYLDSGDQLLQTFSHTGGLAGHAGYTRTDALTIPSGVSGDYYFIAVADQNDRVAETNASNNRANVPVSLSFLPVNLVVSEVIAPRFVTSGQFMKPRWTVSNTGSGPTDVASWHDALYLSRDQVLDSGDHQLGTRLHHGVLGSGESYNDSLEVNVPLGFSGNYYVLARTDRNNVVYEHEGEGDNLGRTVEFITVELPVPADLVVETANVPDGAVAGEMIEITWVVRNQGENPAPDRWSDALFLSSDGEWDLGDVPLGIVEHSGGLAPGKVYRATYQGIIDTNLPGVVPGLYRAVVRTDVRNNVLEILEDNNQGASANPIAAGMPVLVPGVSQSHGIITGAEHFYRIATPPEQDIRLEIDGSTPYTSLKLFVRHGEVPSRAEFDYLYEAVPGAAAIVPGGHGEETYLMIYGDYAPAGTSYEASVAGLPFGVSAVVPSVVGNNGLVSLRMSGGRLESAQALFVRHDTGVRLEPVSRWVGETAVETNALFDTRGLPIGEYDVCAVSAGGDTVALMNGLTVEEGREFDDRAVAVSIEGPTALRPGQTAALLVQIRNTLNVDLRHLVVALQCTPGAVMSTDLPLGWVEEGEQGDAPNTIGFMINGLSPMQAVTVPVRFTGGPGTVSTISASAMLLDEEFMHPNRAPEGKRSYPALWWERLRAESCTDVTSREQIGDPPRPGTVVYRYSKGGLGTAHEAIVYGDEAGGTLMVAENTKTGLFGGTRKITWEQFLAETRFEQEGWMSFWDPNMSQTQVDDMRYFVDTHMGLPYVAPLYKCTDFVNDVLTKGADVPYVPFHSIGNSPNEDYRHVCRRNIPKGPPVAWNIGVDVIRWGYPGFYFGMVLLGEVYQLITVRSYDPNEKVGPTPADGEPFVRATDLLPYTIYFENVPDATAPAQRVLVLDSLAVDLDPRKFRLGEIAFGDTSVAVPAERSFYHTTLELPSGMLLEIDAGVDAQTRVAHWELSTIDPATGMPPVDPSLGFLPPNDSTGVGEGRVTFVIRAQANLEVGTAITNEATIYFDNNEAITTNVVRSVIRGAWPDLAIGAVVLESETVPPMEGSAVELRTTVENRGESTARDVRLAFFEGAPDDGGVMFADTVLVGEMGPQGEVEVNAVWVPQGRVGEVAIYVVVDPEEVTSEEDEENNTWIAGVTVVPRQCRLALRAGVNLVSSPLEPGGPYGADAFAEALGATMLVRADSLGLFNAYIPEDPLAEAFPIEGGVGYIAVRGSDGVAEISGITRTVDIRVRAGLNLVSLPLRPAEDMHARDLTDRLGATMALRHNPTSGVFEPFIPDFHAGDGFVLRGGLGYVVAVDRDTTILVPGSGWSGDLPGEEAGRVAPDGVTANGVAVLGFWGLVQQTAREGAVPVVFACTAEVKNERTGQTASVGVEAGTGHYSGAMVDLSGASGARAGDRLALRIRRASGELFEEGMTYTVTDEDVARHYVRIGEIVLNLPPSITLAERSVPNPTPGRTVICYQLAAPQQVSLRLYSVDGRLVRTLVDGVQRAGYYSTEWTGENDDGRRVAAGVYFYRFSAGKYESSQKIVVLR